MKKPVGVVAAATVVLTLSACGSTPGPLLENYQEGEACTGSDRRPTYVATQAIANRSKSTVRIEDVAPAKHPNSRLRMTLSGPEMNGLVIVGGYDPDHGLDRLRPFEPVDLAPGKTVDVVFVSDVVDRTKDAAVEGVHLEYSSGSQRHEGDIPWTYRFNTHDCN